MSFNSQLTDLTKKARHLGDIIKDKVGENLVKIDKYIFDIQNKLSAVVVNSTTKVEIPNVVANVRHIRQVGQVVSQVGIPVVQQNVEKIGLVGEVVTKVSKKMKLKNKISKFLLF